MLTLYTADWCTNCKPIKLMLKDIEHIIVDIDKEPETARAAGIRGIPTLVNDLGDRLLGAVTLTQFNEFLGKVKGM